MNDMTVKGLKDFLASLPEEFNNFSLSNGEYGQMPENGDGFYYRLDRPIITLFIDEVNKEMCFLHQTQKEIDEIIDEKESEDKINDDKL